MEQSISVITTFYKGNKYVEGLLDIIQLNTLNIKKKYHDFKVQYLLVNDYPQKPLHISHSKKIDFDVVLIENSQNLGIHASRAKGILASHGNYIVILDQDDILSDHALISQFEKIKDNDVVVANGYDERINDNIYKNEFDYRVSINEHYYSYVGNFIISPGQCLMRKKAIPQYWLYNYLKTNCADDYLLWILMFEDKRKFVSNHDCIYIHKYDGNNISSSWDRIYNSNLEIEKLNHINDEIRPKILKTIVRSTNLKKTLKCDTRYTRKITAVLSSLDIVLINLNYKIKRIIYKYKKKNEK